MKREPLSCDKQKCHYNTCGFCLFDDVEKSCYLETMEALRHPELYFGNITEVPKWAITGGKKTKKNWEKVPVTILGFYGNYVLVEYATENTGVKLKSGISFIDLLNMRMCH